MNTQVAQKPSGSERSTRRSMRYPIMLAGALIWSALLIASEMLWRDVFGFTTAEARVLSVGLLGYVGLLVVVMVAIVMNVGDEP